MNKILLSATIFVAFLINDEVKAELSAPLQEHIKQKTLAFYQLKKQCFRNGVMEN